MFIGETGGNAPSTMCVFSDEPDISGVNERRSVAIFASVVDKAACVFLSVVRCNRSDYLTVLTTEGNAARVLRVPYAKRESVELMWPDNTRICGLKRPDGLNIYREDGQISGQKCRPRRWSASGWVLCVQIVKIQHRQIQEDPLLVGIEKKSNSQHKHTDTDREAYDTCAPPDPSTFQNVHVVWRLFIQYGSNSLITRFPWRPVRTTAKYMRP